jgi:hypothetical protein
MKKLIKPVLMLCVVLFMCSCSILKSKKESHTESSTGITQGSASSTASVDTSKKTTDEHWQIFIPGVKLNAQPTAEKFEPLILPDLTGATDDQRKAMAEMQTQYGKLLGAYNKQSQAMDYGEAFSQGMLIDLKRKIDEAAGKSVTEQKLDSSKYEHTEKADVKEKDKKEGISIWHIAIAAMGVIALIFLVRVFK